jgi:hypothetical protein
MALPEKKRNTSITPLTLAGDTYNEQLPKGRGYAAGQAVSKFIGQGVTDLGNDVDNAYSKIQPNLKSIAKLQLMPIVTAGTAIGTGAGMAAEAGRRVGEDLSLAKDSAVDFGRGAFGLNPTPKPVGNINDSQIKDVTQSVFPATANMGLPSPAILPVDKPRHKLSLVDPNRSTNTPTQDPIGDVLSLQNSEQMPNNKAQAPTQIMPRPVMQVGANLSGVPSDTEQRNAPSTYKDFMPELRPDNRIDPLQVETGIDANMLAGGAFGGIAGLQLAQAEMLGAHAQNKHNAVIDGQLKDDRNFALEQKTQFDNSNNAMADNATNKINADRNYKLELEKLTLSDLDKKSQRELDKRKQDSSEGNDKAKLELDKSRLQSTDKANTERLAIERDKVKRPVIKMQVMYDKNGFPAGSRPVAVDSSTGKIISVGDQEVDEEELVM